METNTKEQQVPACQSKSDHCLHCIRAILSFDTLISERFAFSQRLDPKDPVGSIAPTAHISSELQTEGKGLAHTGSVPAPPLTHPAATTPGLVGGLGKPARFCRDSQASGGETMDNGV